MTASYQIRENCYIFLSIYRSDINFSHNLSAQRYEYEYPLVLMRTPIGVYQLQFMNSDQVI